jgi:hypothetical protein
MIFEPATLLLFNNIEDISGFRGWIFDARLRFGNGNVTYCRLYD